jgi:hypothetical protein
MKNNQVDPYLKVIKDDRMFLVIYSSDSLFRLASFIIF